MKDTLFTIGAMPVHTADTLIGFGVLALILLLMIRPQGFTGARTA